MDDRKTNLPLAGRPMEPSAIECSESTEELLPKGAKIVGLEEARQGLVIVCQELPILQSIHDQATSLTEELEILLVDLPAEDLHVREVSEHLASLVTDWEASLSKIQVTGCVLKGLDPGLVDWYGVVDGQLVNFCWKEGESDIEWYHSLEDGFTGRRPLVED